MAYKQSPGRMNMPKTGAGIPSALTMPDPDPKDPKDPKREADRLAAKDPKRKYGKTTVKKDKDEYGFNRVTVSQPYTTSTGGKKTGKSYKQLEKEGGDVAAAKKFNAGTSGTRTRTFTYGNAKPAGVQISAKTPKPKIDLSKKPSIDKDYGSFTYGSNAHNMNFGGHSTYGKTPAGKTPKFSQSYTESPKNPISGRDNIAKSRKITAREDQLMKSDFYDQKHHPMKNKNNFDMHLRNIETFEKRKNDKKFARQELIKSRKKAKK